MSTSVSSSSCGRSTICDCKTEAPPYLGHTAAFILRFCTTLSHTQTATTRQRKQEEHLSDATHRGTKQDTWTGRGTRALVWDACHAGAGAEADLGSADPVHLHELGRSRCCA